MSGFSEAWSGYSSQLNITAATVVKVGPGLIATVSIVVAGSAAGTVFDVATLGGATTTNRIAILPNAVGVIQLLWPVQAGIVVSPGTGQTIAISYS